MIGFELTEEQEAIRELARKFAANEITPRAAEWDEREVFPMDTARKLFDTGLFTATVPEEFGGMGLGIFESCLIAEELAYGCAGFATSVGVAALATYPLLIAGSQELKEHVLNAFTDKLMFGGFCVSEPGAGSDAAAMTTTALRQGDVYILNGQKAWITNAGLAEFYTVFAYTDRSQKHRGVSAFYVPRSTPGITVGKRERKMGQRASDTASVTFENVEVPAAHRIGAEGQGFPILMKTFDKSRPGVGAWSLGVARCALDHARRYALERHQFGQPIGQFQAVQFKLADVAMAIEAARLLTWRAAWTADVGKRATVDASMSKTMASEAAVKATHAAVQIFGGYGISQEYPVEKLYRDAKVLEIYEGTNEIQRLIIARSLLS